MKITMLLLGMALLVPGSAIGKTQPVYAYEGSYVGSMVCDNGEIGVLLRIKENGVISRKDFDELNEPCRSRTGWCNSSREAKFIGTRNVIGVLDLFPMASNPNAVKTRLKLTGIGTCEELHGQENNAVVDPRFVVNYFDVTADASTQYSSNTAELKLKVTIANPFALPPTIP